MSTTDDIEDTILDRIQALLAKAESTNFPEEAEAYVAKAQALGASRTVPVVISGHRERPYGEIVDLLDRLQRQDIHAALMVKPGK